MEFHQVMGPDGRTLSVSRSGPDLSEFKSAKLRNEEFSEMCSGLRNLKKNEISQNKVFKIQNQDELRKSESSEQWYVDSGASKHICTNLSLFTSIDYIDQVVVVADGFKIKAEGIGTVEILVQDQAGRYVKLTLYEVLYFSSKKFSNLISVHKLAQDKFNIKFECDDCIITKQELSIKIKMDYLYTLYSYNVNYIFIK
ncbi:hypothetical protein PVAND_014645 [Polypedilum vanderplanki]|uniref:Retrovirus-related Pol polyprotein from transposon TNT 1-94-like beta-barrel domain-containing protein n=1 Tax=Polypedilum vanderplanki TaxID=319348 RepID=A0A9J6BAB0_POLVA|nr:hypothetical protein PVAND_014645 [Polypedilum vanderplanki]